jgi:hypothetical protein
MSTEHLERTLVSSLVGLAGAERLYLRDAMFKAQVDALASLLPAMVTGLAKAAQEGAQQREEEIRRLMTSQPLFTTDPAHLERLKGDLGL